MITMFALSIFGSFLLVRPNFLKALLTPARRSG